MVSSLSEPHSYEYESRNVNTQSLQESRIANFVECLRISLINQHFVVLGGSCRHLVVVSSWIALFKTSAD